MLTKSQLQKLSLNESQRANIRILRETSTEEMYLHVIANGLGSTLMHRKNYYVRISEPRAVQICAENNLTVHEVKRLDRRQIL